MAGSSHPPDQADGRPLRVAALVKQVPELESMNLGPDGRLQRDGVPLHMNDYCRRGVALGCRLAYESGGSLTVLTLGPPSADNVLREAIAFGADEGVHITDPAFAGCDTLATARALSAALARIGPFDLVLSGRNSVDADTGQVPAQVATLLGLPFAAGARKLTLDGETLRLLLEHGDEWVEAEVELPAAVSCAERLCDPCKIKDPAVWATVSGDRIRRLSAGDLGPGPWGQAGSATTVGAIRHIAPSRTPHVVRDGSIAEQVAAIMRVLGDRAALGAHVAENRAHLKVPAAGQADGPEIVVAIEPARPQAARELLGTAACLATAIGGRVMAFGPSPGGPLQLSAWGADEAIVARGSEAEEDIARALADRSGCETPWAILGPGTPWGREVLARAAVALGAGLTGDAVGLEARDGRLVASKPAFGGQLVAEIRCLSPTQMATVRTGFLPRLEPRDATTIQVRTLSVEARGRMRVLSRERDDDIDELATSRVVIGVGMGVLPEDYPLLRDLAQRIGAALCATRKVTDTGRMPRARQVGITGHAIEPRLYLSLGASGTFNHMVGVRAAGTVVAVNTDPAAPIFGYCDVGVVGDWKAVMPELAAALVAARTGDSLTYNAQRPVGERKLSAPDRLGASCLAAK